MPFRTRLTTPILPGRSTWGTLLPTVRRPGIIRCALVTSPTLGAIFRDQGFAFNANKLCLSVSVDRHTSSSTIDFVLPSTGHATAFEPPRTVLATLALPMLGWKLVYVLHPQTCEASPVVAFDVMVSRIQVMQLALGLTVVVSMEVVADFILIDSL